MNDNQIDSLFIDIHVKDNGAAKIINDVTSAINGLVKSLSGLDKFSSVLDKLSSVKMPKSTLSNIKNTGKKVSDKLKTTEVPTDDNQGAAPIGKLEKSTSNNETKIENVKNLLRHINNLTKDVNTLGKETDKTKSKWDKLTDSFKRIAFYRIVRSVLKGVANVLKEGIQNVANFSDEVKDSINNISSSFTIFKNAIGLALAPIIQIAAPIIKGLATGIAQVSNAISYLTAKLRGQSTYLKVNTEYMKEMQEQGNLLSFDTFETLSGGDSSANDMFVEEEVAKAGDEYTGILATLEAIGALLIAFGTYKIIEWLKNGGLDKINLGLSNILDKFKNLNKDWKSLLTTGGGILGIAGGLFMTLQGITNWLNWDEQTSGLQKFLDVLTTVLGVASAIAGVIALHKGKTVAGMIAGGLAVAGVIGAIIASSFSQAEKVKTHKSYALGGEFQTSDVFYANENGTTEMIASSNTGGNVMNLEQWASISYSSFYRALSDYNAAQNTRQTGINVDSLGTMVANNQGFINAFNRRNPSLRIK